MSRIHADARAASGFNSQEDDFEDDAEDGAHKPVGSDVLNRTIKALSDIAADRAALAERERDIKKDWQANGGSKGALAMLMKLHKMEPDDRTDFLAELDAYATFLRYW